MSQDDLHVNIDGKNIDVGDIVGGDKLTAGGDINQTIVNIIQQGEPHGRLLFGDGSLQQYVMGADSGSVVTMTGSPIHPQITPSARPLRKLPRPFRNLHGRDREQAKIIRALENEEPVQIYGPNGIGKTSLVRVIAHNAPKYADGIVYVRLRQATEIEDVLQALFDIFFIAPHYKPNLTQLENSFQEVQALIILDDADLNRQAVDDLINAIPFSTVLFTSPTRTLRGEGKALPLTGLDEESALELFKKELGRELSQEEDAGARELINRVFGHPLQLLQAAEQVDEGTITLTQLAHQVETTPQNPGKTIRETAAATLTDKEQQILAILGTLKGTPIHQDHVGVLLNTPQISQTLQKLEQRGFVQSHSPRYSIREPRLAVIDERWQQQLVNYFADWAEFNRHDLPSLIEDADTVLAIINHLPGRLGEQGWRLGRIIEPALNLSKQWGAWQQLLANMMILPEGRDPLNLAWINHQQGVRHLGNGHKEKARDSFARAQELRTRSGATIDAAVSQYHLELIDILPPLLQRLPGESQTAVPQTTTANSTPTFWETVRNWFRANQMAPTLVALVVVAGFASIMLRSNPINLDATETAVATGTTTSQEEALGDEPTHTPTPEPTDTERPVSLTATNTPNPSVTPVTIPTETNTPTPSATPTNTPSPTTRPTNTPTLTPSPTIPPLSFKFDQTWFVDEKDPNTALSEITIYPTGGDGTYAYYLNSEKQDGETFSYGWRYCQISPITLAVQSGDGQLREEKYSSTAPCPAVDTPTIIRPKEGETVSAESCQKTAVFVDWTSSTFATSYEWVLRADSTNQILQSGSVTSSDATVTLTECGSYVWGVTAVGGGGQTSKQATVSFNLFPTID